MPDISLAALLCAPAIKSASFLHQAAMLVTVLTRKEIAELRIYVYVNMFKIMLGVELYLLQSLSYHLLLQPVCYGCVPQEFREDHMLIESLRMHKPVSDKVCLVS